MKIIPSPVTSAAQPRQLLAGSKTARVRSATRSLAGLGLLLLASSGLARAQAPAGAAQPKVPFERILHANNEPGSWLTTGGDYAGHRYSTLTQITPANVAKLKPVWIYQQPDTTKWEVTPLVVDGVMYISERPNIVTALDVRTGRPLWNYRRPFPTDVPICCGTPNRGLAILGPPPPLGTAASSLH